MSELFNVRKEGESNSDYRKRLAQYAAKRCSGYGVRVQYMETIINGVLADFEHQLISDRLKETEK